MLTCPVSSTSAAVPGWYEGKYEEEVPEPLPVVSESYALRILMCQSHRLRAALVQVDGSDDDDEKDDDIKTDIKSTYSATVSCEMPVIELTDAMIDAATVGPAAGMSRIAAPIPLSAKPLDARSCRWVPGACTCHRDSC